MIAGASWCTEIPEAKMRVAGDCGDDTFGMWAPLRGVGATASGKGEHAAFTLRVPDLDGFVPG